jgi:hypothetical protein
MMKQYFIALMCITTIGMQYGRPSSSPYSVEKRTAEESLAQNKKAEEWLASIVKDMKSAFAA